MWNRRDWGRLCASALLGTALPGARAQVRADVPPRTALPRLLVAVDHKSAFCYLPLTIAERLGYFSSEGLDVQVREFPDATQAMQAVLSGAAQVVSGAYSSTISLQARGQALQSFVLQGRASQLVLGVSQRTLADYRGLRDLRGRKVGVMALGSASHRVVSLLMTRAGLPRNEVQYVALPEPLGAVQAFRSGKIDAICYSDPTITRLELGGELRVVADMRTVRGNAEVFGGPLPAGCLGALPAFLETQPQQCQAMAHALVRALKWLQTAGPSDLIKTVPESYFQGDRALYLAAFSRAREAWTPDGLMPAGGPETAARAMSGSSEPGLLPRVDLARTFTNEFAQRAKARFRA